VPAPLQTPEPASVATYGAAASSDIVAAADRLLSAHCMCCCRCLAQRFSACDRYNSHSVAERPWRRCVLTI
jgi:hypothetical protein